MSCLEIELILGNAWLESGFTEESKSCMGEV